MSSADVRLGKASDMLNGDVLADAGESGKSGTFSITHQVDSTEIDMFSRLRLSAFFRLLQKVSVLHCEALGAGRKVTLDRGILWVVTMQHGEFTRMPCYEEKVTIETWPGNTVYSLFPRYYRMLDTDGGELARVSSIWTHVDMNSREVIPPVKSGIKIDPVVTGNEISMPVVPRSIAPERNVNYRVPYSYIDLNQHMNNSCYFDIAENEFGPSREGRPVREIDAQYSGELHLDDEIRLLTGHEGDRYFISGEKKKRMFALSMVYGQKREH